MKAKHSAHSVPVEIRGLLIILIVLLTSLCLISFRNGSIEANWLGLAGYIVAFSLQYTFGIASYLFLIFFGWTGLRLIKDKEISHFSLRFLYFSILIASTCFLLNLSAEAFPLFANSFKPIVYTQTVTLHTSLTYQKVRINLGGTPFYYLYKDLSFFNLNRILSGVGVAIVFSITLLVSFLQLTRWRLAFMAYDLIQKALKKDKKEKSTKPSSPFFSFLNFTSEKKGFLDTIINVPTKPFDTSAVDISPLKRKSQHAELPDSLKVLMPPKKEKVTKKVALPAPKAIPGEYQLPPISLLTEVKTIDTSLLKKDLAKQAQILEETLLSFGIEAKVGQIYCGPTITSFEVHPAIGVKVQKIKTLESDIALNLQAKAIRILAPIPGKAAVGVEIPSPKAQEVGFKDLIDSYLKNDRRYAIPILLGKTVTGDDVLADLTKMPHSIIAGATGSGKSVCINTIIMSILMTAKPSEIKLLMVDPKKVELTAYNELPHLIAPVITDANTAAAALNWLVKEMEKRYELLKQVGARNVASFNERKKTPEESEEIPEKLPYIVGIIDELADLMMVASQDIETPIARIAQMARAVGIHLILATQRPSREVITGLIKANFPTRIAFKVASRVNSLIILDDIGAESLLGNGDMLFLPPGTSTLIRTQGAFIRDEDINRVIRFISEQAPTNYLIKSFDVQDFMDKSKEDAPLDTLYGQALAIVQETGTASTTFLQRKLKIGYARAASLVDQLEEQGIISPQEGSKPRKVLITKDLGLMRRTVISDPTSEDFEI